MYFLGSKKYVRVLASVTSIPDHFERGTSSLAVSRRIKSRFNKQCSRITVERVLFLLKEHKLVRYDVLTFTWIRLPRGSMELRRIERKEPHLLLATEFPEIEMHVL